MRFSFLSLLSTCALASSCLFAEPAVADDSSLVTIDRYTAALQSGDVAALKDLLGGRLYLKRRALLEDNSTYPDWLREYYAGARFSSSLSQATARTANGTVVELVVELASGETARADFVLERAADGDGWKIIDQL